MKKFRLALKTAAAAVIILVAADSLAAQRPTTPRGDVKDVVFAVLNDGKMIEPPTILGMRRLRAAARGV